MRAAVFCAVLSIFVALTACSADTAPRSSASTSTGSMIKGEMRYRSPVGVMEGAGSDCNAFHPSLPRVTVYDGSGEIVGFTAIDPTTETEHPATRNGQYNRVCVWTFQVTGLPQADVYRLTAAGFSDVLLHDSDLRTETVLFGRDVT